MGGSASCYPSHAATFYMNVRTEPVVVGVTIRFVEDSYSVTLTVKGELPESLVEVLAADLKEKLSRVENAECIVEPIE